MRAADMHSRYWNLTYMYIGIVNLIYMSMKQIPWKLKVLLFSHISSNLWNWNNNVEFVDAIFIWVYN